MPYMFFGIKTDGSASVLFGTPHFAFGYDSPLVQRDVVLNQLTGGTITADVMSGYDGDIITLSNTADAGYTFNTYNLTGATLTGNQFAFSGSDVTVEPSWNHTQYSVTLTQVAGGRIAASPTTGYYGTQVTLSNTPSSEYTFGSYSITGATLTSNKFNFGTSDVTAKGSFKQKTYTLTLQTDGHGKLAASKTTGHKGDTVTLTPTYSSYYRFNNYAQTGGSINGNTFTFGSQNATAKANFKVNAFTATGDFGTCQYSGKDGTKSCTANGILRGHTAVSWPSTWPANGSTWNVSNAKSYGIKANTTWQVTGYSVTGYGCVVLGGVIKKTSTAAADGATHSVNFTANMAVNSTQGKLTISGQKKPATTSYKSLIKKTAGSWTATGNAP